MSSSDSDSDDVERLQYKVILLGNGAVGKTSIAHRFTQDYFSKRYKQASPRPTDELHASSAD